MYMYNEKTHSSSNLGKEVVKQERLWWLKQERLWWLKQERLWWQSHASWIYLCSIQSLLK
jgi:hypothetical protein